MNNLTHKLLLLAGIQVFPERPQDGAGAAGQQRGGRGGAGQAPQLPALRDITPQVIACSLDSVV